LSYRETNISSIDIGVLKNDSKVGESIGLRSYGSSLFNISAHILSEELYMCLNFSCEDKEKNPQLVSEHIQGSVREGMDLYKPSFPTRLKI
jgi:hypothetical protein